jgi:hypothetical protein
MLVRTVKKGEVEYGFEEGRTTVNQCCISCLGESIGEGPECNLSVTTAENIGISRKMSQDLKQIQKHSFYSIF